MSRSKINLKGLSPLQLPVQAAGSTYKIALQFEVVLLPLQHECRRSNHSSRGRDKSWQNLLRTHTHGHKFCTQFQHDGMHVRGFGLAVCWFAEIHKTAYVLHKRQPSKAKLWAFKPRRRSQGTNLKAGVAR